MMLVTGPRDSCRSLVAWHRVVPLLRAAGHGAIPVSAMVFVNAMIPCPGETPGAWWGNTGWSDARLSAAEQGGYSTEFDLAVYFLHDREPARQIRGEAAGSCGPR